MIMTDEPVDDDGHPLGGDDGGGSVPEVAQPAVTKRPGSSTKGRTPNVHFGFCRAFNESHLIFVELSTKIILLSEKMLSEISESFRRALNEIHPVFVELPTKVILLS